jgi:hypothetical protein
MMFLVEDAHSNLSWAQEVFDFVPTQPSPQASSQASSHPERWPTIPLLEQYRGEETKGVRYLSRQERSKTRLYVDRGALLDTDKTPLNHHNQPPTSRPISHFPEQPPKEKALAAGFAIYVMDAQGHISISFEAEPHRFHHSSLTSGMPVAAAGEMIIFAGRLYAINNRSGHYRPPPIALSRVIKVLTRMGVNFDGVFIKRYGSDF